MNKTITDENVIECCNCSNDLSHEHCICCDGKCYYCWECTTFQYINMDRKTEEGHNIICEKYCDYCRTKTSNIDKNNFIEFSDDFIFNSNNDVSIKYSDKFYHYDCLCKFLGNDYMKLVCSKCKIYCKDISNMRNVNNHVNKKDINVCITCFNETNIRKCYNNKCNGQYVLPICCETRGRINYAMACKKCSEEDWIKQYCDMCR